MNLRDLVLGKIYHSGDKGMPRQMPVLLVEKTRLWQSRVEGGRAAGLTPCKEFPPSPQRVGSLKEATVGMLVVTRAFGQRNDDRHASLLDLLRTLVIPQLPADRAAATNAAQDWQQDLDEHHLLLIASSSRVWPSVWDKEN
jgi:hypothetical protein